MTRHDMLLWLLASGLLFPAAVRAQDGGPPAAPAEASAQHGSSHGLGFTAGLVSGLGFAYRKHFDNHFGLQIAGIGWGTRTSSFANLGAELIRTVSQSEKVRFYGVAAASVFRESNPEYDYRTCYPPTPPDNRGPVPCTPVETRRTSGSLNFGAGIGLEFGPSRHVGVSLELPVTLMLDLERENRFTRKGVYPIPSVSLVYYF